MGNIMIKVVAYDKHEAIYSWKGLHIIGSKYDADSYMFRFPEIDADKAIKEKIDISYVFRDYEIPRFQEGMKSFFEKTVKEDLENKLKESLNDPLNQEVLMMLVLDNVVVIDK